MKEWRHSSRHRKLGSVNALSIGPASRQHRGTFCDRFRSRTTLSEVGVVFCVVYGLSPRGDGVFR